MSKKEQDLLGQALRERERELKALEEKIREQEDMLQNLNILMAQSDRAISALTTVQHLYGSGQNVREMADAFLELTCKAARCEAGALALREGENRPFRIVAAIGDRQQIVRQHVFNEGDGLMGEVARTGDPLLIPDARREPRLRREGPDFIQRESRNALCIPITGARGVSGSLLLVNTIGRQRFNRQDIDLQTLLAVRLARELDREAESGRARDDANRFSTLLRITEIVHSTQEPHKVYDLIIQLSCRLGKAKGAAVFMADESQQLLTCVAASEKMSSVSHVTVGEGVVGWVALEGQALMTDLRSDERFVGYANVVFNAPVETVVALPIRGGQRINGVLEVVNKLNGRQFDQSDLTLLSILVREAGIALDRLQQIRQDQRTIVDLLRGLARFIDSKAPQMAGHSERVAKIAQTLAEELGLAPAETNQVYMAGLLHDLGNVGVDDEIFIAPRQLTGEETERMRKHPAVGAEILRDVAALRHLMPGPLYHHERFDGTGYPHGLKGESIPQMARILAVAEVYDATRTPRPYRKAMSPAEALGHVRQGEGTQFDPRVVAALMGAYQRGKLPG